MTSCHHIAITGHRPTKLGGYNLDTPGYYKLQQDLEQYIRFMLSQHDRLTCHSGLALGADTIWSKAVLNMRETYPTRVYYHAEVPMMTQSERWPFAADRLFWKRCVDSADFVTIYGEVSSTMSAGKLLNNRNIGMVDHCDTLLAVFDGSPSGTKNAIDYAKRKSKEIVMIEPTKYF